MPIYETQCKDCRQIIEQFLKLEESTLDCPVCGGKTEKIISAVRFKLTYNPRTDVCDWEGNTSQYWDAMKKAKEDGRDVIPADEAYPDQFSKKK